MDQSPRNTITRRKVAVGTVGALTMMSSGCMGRVMPPPLENIAVQFVDIQNPNIGLGTATLPFVLRFSNRGNVSIPEVTLSADIYINNQPIATSDTDVGTISPGEEVDSTVDINVDFGDVGQGLLNSIRQGQFNIVLDGDLQADGLIFDANRPLRIQSSGGQQTGQSGEGSMLGSSGEEGLTESSGGEVTESSQGSPSLTVPLVDSLPEFDGFMGSQEYADANQVTLTFENYSGRLPVETPVALAHDGANLIVAIYSKFTDGWDSHASVDIDGDHDGRLQGNMSPPYTDFKVGVPAPNAWDGYHRFQVLGRESEQMVSSAAVRTSGTGSEGVVHYEFGIPLDAIGISPGDTFGLQLRTHTPEHGEDQRYFWPVPPTVSSDPSDWAAVTLKE